MRQFYCKILKNGDTEFQNAPYIEDGWYIVNTKGMFEVWYIPLGGGKEQLYKTVDSFSEALKVAISIT